MRKIKLIIKEWLFERELREIAELDLAVIALRNEVDRHKATLDAEDWDNLRRTASVVRAILDYLELTVAEIDIPDPTYDVPRPKMMRQLVVEKRKINPPEKPKE